MEIAKEYLPEGVLVIKADDDNGVDYVPECDEDNNVLRIDGLLCE